MQVALNPELVNLYGKRQFERLFNLIKRIVKSATVSGLVLLVICLILVKPIILLLSTEEYLAALPVCYIMLVTVYITFISLPFFCLALSMDKLGRRNLFVSIRIVYILIFTVTCLNARTMALAQLLGSITVRIFNDIPLFREFKGLMERGKDASPAAQPD